MSEGHNNNVYDYTVYKLERILLEEKSPLVQEALMGLMDAYYQEQAAISWEGNTPLAIPLVSETGVRIKVLPPRFGAMGYDENGVYIEEEEVEQGD